MIKALKKLRIEETFFNIIKAIYDNHRANNILNAELLKTFPKIKNEMSDSFTFNQ
jgi:hypothetical protein